MAVNLADLETGFRAENRNVYLIAKVSLEPLLALST